MMPATREVLTRLEARMRRESEQMRAGAGWDADQMMLPVGPEVGRLLNILAKTVRAKRVLEVGTSVGYSTLWLADAAASTGGTVYSTEAVPDKHRQARENLIAAGLIGHVAMHTGDALATIRRLAGPFDLALIDLWKNLYVPAFDAMLPKLAPGALIAADNMLYPASAHGQAQAYRRHVAGQTGMESVLLPIGNGIELTRRRAEDPPLDAAVHQVLARLEQRAAREEATRKSLNEAEYRGRLGEFMLPVGPESGRFLHLLAKAGRRTRILELGTSVGYSTLWLADAARANGGRVQTIDNSPGKLAEAQANLRAGGVLEVVGLIPGNVLDVIARLPGPFDLVLLDYNRSEFIACVEALLPKLAPGALLAADNMLEPQATKPAAEVYRAHVAAHPRLETVLVPIGNGIEVTRFSAP